jgi:hypothetical protein
LGDAFEEILCPKDPHILDNCVEHGISHFDFDEYMKRSMGQVCLETGEGGAGDGGAREERVKSPSPIDGPNPYQLASNAKVGPPRKSEKVTSRDKGKGKGKGKAKANANSKAAGKGKAVQSTKVNLADTDAGQSRRLTPEKLTLEQTMTDGVDPFISGYAEQVTSCCSMRYNRLDHTLSSQQAVTFLNRWHAEDPRGDMFKDADDLFVCELRLGSCTAS